MRLSARFTAAVFFALTGAVLLVHPSLCAVDITSDEFHSYVKEIATRVRSNWHDLPLGKKPAAVLVLVRPDGRLALLRLQTSSNAHRVDESALQAVKQSAPFEALPPPHDPTRCVALLIKFSNDFLMHRYAKAVSAWVEDADWKITVWIMSRDLSEQQRKNVDEFLQGGTDALTGVDTMPLPEPRLNKN